MNVKNARTFKGSQASAKSAMLNTSKNVLTAGMPRKNAFATNFFRRISNP